ncbi:hypothetical protein [Stenotrophomonas sp. YIM B06876]|uniref:hypothetical protein n=1 Tax=Stenotrophomonas sp. YIM B06876 TaxID=3060211 RepID=UPI002738A339|nr:hypothetical protein [Stenotrophomonas sp. YIM B06876]
MILEELIGFLLPNREDMLQIGVFVVISAFVLITAIITPWTARPAAWEKKWNGGRSGKSLNIDHGSVTDLWNAVATSPEKIADIMPGLLLVFGLLGTFIGLGMALNNASELLDQSRTISTNAMNDELGVLLNNLGSKFKTSSWGIIGFISLKIYLALWRLEENRLAWVIDKVKDDLEKRRDEDQNSELNKQELLFSAIAATGKNIVSAIASIENKFDADSGFMQRQDDANRMLRETCNSVSGIQATNVLLRDICAATTRTSSEMVEFSTGTREIVQQMATAGQHMASGSKKVAEAAEDLKRVVDEFNTEFKQVLSDVRQDLGNAIAHMSEESAATLKAGSDGLSKATENISSALDTLSHNVQDTLQQVKESTERSLKIQESLQNDFSVQTENVAKSINESIREQVSTRDSITTGLNAVSDTRMQVKKATEAVGSLAGKMDEIATNMERVSGKISDVAPQLMDRMDKIISLKSSQHDTSQLPTPAEPTEATTPEPRKQPNGPFRPART